jgi:hypothetical protein
VWRTFLVHFRAAAGIRKTVFSEVGQPHVFKVLNAGFEGRD